MEDVPPPVPADNSSPKKENSPRKTTPNPNPFIHTSPKRFHPHKNKKFSQYGVIVGKVMRSTEKSITGRSGDHLEFNLDLGNEEFYQVTINVRSRHGTNIEFFCADEEYNYGEHQTPEFGYFNTARLSYPGLGLEDIDFRQISEKWITSKLEAELNGTDYVEVYGNTYKDGKLNGIHNIHYTGIPNQDGAIAMYDSTSRNRTWLFLKFAEQTIE